MAFADYHDAKRILSVLGKRWIGTSSSSTRKNVVRQLTAKNR